MFRYEITLELVAENGRTFGLKSTFIYAWSKRRALKEMRERLFMVNLCVDKSVFVQIKDIRRV